MKPLATAAASFGVNFLAGVGLALAVAGILAGLLVPPVPPAPAPTTPAPITTQAPPITRTRPDLTGLTVVQLRTIARAELGSSARIGGRKIAQSRKAELIKALNGFV